MMQPFLRHQRLACLLCTVRHVVVVGFFLSHARAIAWHGVG